MIVQLITTVLSLVAIITAFFSSLWGWIVLAIPTTFLVVSFIGVKQQQWKTMPELSERANVMLKKYGHYYTMPSASREFCSASSTIMLTSAVVAIIGAFNGLWWELAIGLVSWFAMSFLARGFNPTNYIVDPVELEAHKEVISFMMARQSQRREQQSA